MSGYRFRLQPVLRVRQLQEEQRRIEMSVARRAEDAAMAATTSRRASLAASRSAAEEDVSLAAYSRRRDRQDRMLEALVASQMAEANAADLRRDRQEEWEAAVVALKTLERLEERARETYRLELERDEQLELDELASTRAGSVRAERPDATEEER